MRFVLMLLFAGAVCAQDFESFRVEGAATFWITSAAGTIQSGITPIDLRSDLNIERNQLRFMGKLVMKPSRRNRFFAEGLPYRLSGVNNVTRQFTFAGQTYTLQDRVTSHADIDYVSGGYQRDLLSRPQGHFGLLAAVSYVNATGTVQSQNFGFSGTEKQSFPFPVAGAEGRVFVLPHSNLININGEIKGMSLGDYGRFLQGGIHGGISLGRHVTFQAGYMVVDADVHRKDQTRGFTPRFTGPVFSIQLRDR